MLKSLKHITLLSCVLFSMSTTAQKDSIVQPHQHKTYLKGDHLTESPYEISFKKEIPYLGVGLGLIGSGVILKLNNEEDPFTLEELNQLDISKINSLDRRVTKYHSKKAAKTSDIIQYSGMLMPLLFLSSHNTRNDFMPILVMGAEVFTITSGLIINSKYAFNRSRPLTYNPTFTFEERTGATSRLSFFSGHTATSASFSFFMAKVIHDYHPNLKTGYKIGLWTFAAGIPATTALMRVKAGKHFYSDVAVGFAVGATIGWLVPHLHKKKDKDSKVSLTPFNYNNATGLTLTLKLD